MMRLAPALTALLLATPTLAQEAPTSAEVFDRFTTRCAEIAADPEGAVSAAFGSDLGGGAVTSDKAMLTYQERLEFSDDLFAIVFFQREIQPGGTISFCTFNLSSFGSAPELNLADMPDIVAARVEALLGGPVTRAGSGVLQGGEPAQMFRWTSGEGFPPPRNLNMMQGGNTISLSIGTIEPTAN
ncbi:MAG: hypothetical protein HC844_02415 [Tabrizicola sp.]|nr:hypothetical protein [Tabrizicola sp.]